MADQGHQKGHISSDYYSSESSDEDICLSASEMAEEGGDEEEAEFEFGTDCIFGNNDTGSKSWIPRCPVDEKPYIGKVFKSIADGKKFYEDYAELVGFDIKSTTAHKFSRSDIFKLKYFMCTKEGAKNDGSSTRKRKTTTDRVGCKAKMTLKCKDEESCEVHNFVECHSHDMMPNIAKHFLKHNRRLDIGHKRFMMSCAKANLGHVKSYKLMKEIVGGYANMRALAIDFRNFKRDLMKNISASDAQMVINRFAKKKEQNDAFYFEYSVNNSDQLTRLFWADPISRRNYALFGDVVSFDSTFRTNRYYMVFAPFTGLDNHNKCVTFAGGLVMKEDIPSYEWLFEHFKKAMGHAPKMIVTDQDPAMKVAIVNILPETRHRLCMWHIMEKVSKKVGVQKINSKDFRKRLGGLVWSDSLSITEFEDGWKEFVMEYDLEKNSWFSDMFNLRKYWIPAYFQDMVLGGLVRTTSISESQNSFFGAYSSRNYSLVELLMQYDSALDTQRHNQLKNDINSTTRSHALKTPLLIEKSASEVYSLTMFALVQDEITKACYECNVTNENHEDVEGIVVYSIKEGHKQMFRVEYMKENDFTTCSCMMFNRMGLPCRHIFTAFKCIGLNQVPDSMVLDRWRKDATKIAKKCVTNEVWEQSTNIEEKQSLMNELWSIIYSCVGLVEEDKEKIKDLIVTLKGKKESYIEVVGDADKVERVNSTMIESFAEINTPDVVSVHPPGQAKNKGSGKRLKSGKETAVLKQQKPLRKCKRCNKYASHDSRNCKEIV